MGIEATLKRLAKQTAVYWSSPTAGADGSNSFSTGVEIKCIWLDTKEKVIDNNGKEVVGSGAVYVLQDLDEEGMLFLGSLSDLTAAEKLDPKLVSMASEIRIFKKTPSLHLSGKFIRKALLWRRV